MSSTSEQEVPAGSTSSVRSHSAATSFPENPMHCSRYMAALIIGLAVTSGLSPSAADAQGTSWYPIRPGNEAALYQFAPEFPPDEALVPQRSSRMEAQMQRLQTVAPDSPELFEMLLYLERFPQALEVLQRIASKDPVALAHPLGLIYSRGVFRDPGMLAPILKDARQRLAVLPDRVAAPVLL